MNVLVTGGAGYIGSHTAKGLVQSGHKPVVLDNLDRGHEWAVKWGPFVKGDISDKALLSRTFRERKIEAVIHFAAHSQVGESMKEPFLYFQNNVANTLTLLQAMKEAKVMFIIFSSSAAVYGNPEKTPIPESHPLRPVNPYGETKRVVETMLHWFSEAYGLKWMALRYFNAAGADPDAEIGEDHAVETHLIPIALEAAMGKRKQLEIFGKDYETPDGTAIRDYIHVIDLADAHLRALNHLQQGGKSEALNVGTGKGNSVREVIAMVEKVTGKKVPAKEAPRRAGDPPVLVADASRIQKILQWKPQFSDLETIIKTAYRWTSQRRDGPKSTGL